MGYIILAIIVIVAIPLVFLLASKKPSGQATQGEKPIGKPVMVEQPSADEANPAESSTGPKDTTAAQRKTPPA